jgi:hypothetical protein
MVVMALLAVAGFCGYGFLATFEPPPPGTNFIAWRIGYGAIGLGCLASAAWLLCGRLHAKRNS